MAKPTRYTGMVGICVREHERFLEAAERASVARYGRKNISMLAAELAGSAARDALAGKRAIPPMPPKAPKNSRRGGFVKLSLAAPIRQAIEEAAEKAGVSLSWIIEEAITREARRLPKSGKQ